MISGVMLPGCYPIEHSDLESSESFGVIIVAIYFFTVEESVDVEKIEIETEDVGPLFITVNSNHLLPRLVYPLCTTSHSCL
jgi:hypothetical protein